jgi:hypothetical protein
VANTYFHTDNILIAVAIRDAFNIKTPLNSETTQVRTVITVLFSFLHLRKILKFAKWDGREAQPDLSRDLQIENKLQTQRHTWQNAVANGY